MNESTSISDLLDEKKLIEVFRKYDEKYFNRKLKDVKVLWSNRMTLCTGKTYLNERGNYKFCSIYLSKPLLMQRSIEDSINTLLHEMIHAYLFLTKDKIIGEGHGEDFKNHMVRINALEGSRIKIRHTFLKEVNKFRVHVYKCDGPCRFNKPFYGLLRRAILRPPGPEDNWWTKHSMECGGTFHKISDSGLETDARLPRKTLPMLRQRDFQSGEGSKSFKFVKGNVNPAYESKVRRISSGIQKYIKKYIEATFHKINDSEFETDAHSSAARRAPKLTLPMMRQRDFRSGEASNVLKFVKGNVNPGYESKVERISSGIQKYVKKYVDYNGRRNSFQSKSHLNSNFRQNLNSNIEKYIAKLRVSLNHRPSYEQFKLLKRDNLGFLLD